jgi:hypothetical protein
LSVVSKILSAKKNVIAVTGSLMAGYPAERRGAGGSLEGGVGRGSGEARSVSDIKFQKAMSCHMGLSGEHQNGVKKAQNRRFLRKKGQFRRISEVLEGVLTDIH